MLHNKRPDTRGTGALVESYSFAEVISFFALKPVLMPSGG